jgi:hypothetical protein
MAQMPMRIGEDPRIISAQCVSHLAIGTLTELTKLDDETFGAALASDNLHPPERCRSRRRTKPIQRRDHDHRPEQSRKRADGKTRRDRAQRYLRQQTEKVREVIRGMTDSGRDRVLRDAVKPEASA